MKTGKQGDDLLKINMKKKKDLGLLVSWRPRATKIEVTGTL